MDILTQLIGNVNDVILTYILIIMLLGCAFWFTYKTKFVQFRMIGEMVRLLGDSTGKTEGREHHISSFQAFAISIASRVGTGNLAGVATAITLGGPGAVFWMWVIALFGASSAFIESTLAQLYKVHGHNSFVGGPAYYMKKGLKHGWEFYSPFCSFSPSGLLSIPCRATLSVPHSRKLSIFLRL